MTDTAFCRHCGQGFIRTNRRQVYCRDAHKVASCRAAKRKKVETAAKRRKGKRKKGGSSASRPKRVL